MVDFHIAAAVVFDSFISLQAPWIQFRRYHRWSCALLITFFHVAWVPFLFFDSICCFPSLIVRQRSSALSAALGISPTSGSALILRSISDICSALDLRLEALRGSGRLVDLLGVLFTGLERSQSPGRKSVDSGLTISSCSCSSSSASSSDYNGRQCPLKLAFPSSNSPWPCSPTLPTHLQHRPSTRCRHPRLHGPS